MGILLLPGQTHPGKGGAPLSNRAPFGAPLVNKAFDSDGLPTALDARGAMAGILPRANPALIRVNLPGSEGSGLLHLIGLGPILLRVSVGCSVGNPWDMERMDCCSATD